MRLFLALWLFAFPAFAQVGQVAPPVYAPGSGGGFVGPVDAAATTALMCVSFARGCTTAYSTGSNQMVSALRASDSRTCNINVSNTGGMSPLTGCSNSGDNGLSYATWISGTTGTVTTPTDQSGNGNSPPGTAGYLPSCDGSIVCATFDGSTQFFFASTFSTTLAQPYTFAAVFQYPSGIASNGAMFAQNAVSIGAQNASGCTPNTSPCATAYAGLGQQSIPATTGAWHSLIVVVNGASSTYSIDGATPTTVGASLGTNGLDATQYFSIGAFAYTYQFFTGSLEEVMIFVGALSTGHQTALCHNIRLYYTTGGTC